MHACFVIKGNETDSATPPSSSGGTGGGSGGSGGGNGGMLVRLVQL